MWVEKIRELRFNSESMKNLSYDIKVAGAVARFDHLIELNKTYLEYSADTDLLSSLKSKWELIASKLMKCSVTLKRDYYMKIFEVEIPEIVSKELTFYQELLKSGGL
jgi:hypothetical protein